MEQDKKNIGLLHFEKKQYNQQTSGLPVKLQAPRTVPCPHLFCTTQNGVLRGAEAEAGVAECLWHGRFLYTRLIAVTGRTTGAVEPGNTRSRFSRLP